MTRSIERRAARTRRARHEALMQLIVRKGYDAITVQDLIDEADVGRSTFYAHYKGKEDLLRSGFDTLRALLAGEQQRSGPLRRPPKSGALTFSLALFEHACEYKHVFRALVGGRGGTIAVNEIRRILSDLVTCELAADDDDVDIPEAIRVRFVVDTFLTVLSWSLQRRPALRPQQMNEIFRRLVLHGIGPPARDLARRLA